MNNTRASQICSTIGTLFEQLGDAFKSLFGEGLVRVKAVTTDGDVFTAKIPYVGCVEVEKEELFEHLDSQMRKKYAKRVRPGSMEVLSVTRIR